MQLNNEGFLKNSEDWNIDIAHSIAKTDDIELRHEHLEIIQLAQDFYHQFDHSPSMRPLVKYIKQHLGSEKGNSIYLLTLFPESPAKLACKYAGLPKPEKCL